MMSKGVFTISLDFELYWGVRDHRSLSAYGENIRKVHELTPRLLDLFVKYNVHCTWASVGFLFHPDKASLLEHIPAGLPAYQHPAYDPYPYIGGNELEAAYHFAPDLIRMIASFKGQEIATHTYSHFYTLEKNTTVHQFEEDIRMAISVAGKKGYNINSIVFPRNQYNADHIEVCRRNGIRVFRGNETSSVYRPLSREEENSRRRAIRLLDAYINITGHHCHPWPAKAAIIDMPASRFLRPYSKKLRWLDELRFRRIKNSLLHAARNGLIFHLWWHPHNFGKYTEENFAFLERILKVYKKLQENSEMESLTLYEIYERTG